MDAFIAGESVLDSSGSFATNPNSRSLDWDAELPIYSDAAEIKKRAMAERTDKLISSYKNFISGQEDEEMMGGHGNSTTSHVRNRSSSTSGETENILEEDDRSVEKKYRYSHPYFRSKKFKRVMLGAVVGCAFIGIFLSIVNHKKTVRDEEGKQQLEAQIGEQESTKAALRMTAVDKVPEFSSIPDVQNSQMGPPNKKTGVSISPTAKVEGGTSDKGSKVDNISTSAAASIVEEVSVHKEEQLTEKEELNYISLNDHPAVGVGTESITRHVLCCSGDVTSTESNKKGVQTNLSESKAAQDYEAAESFNPKWYDRSSGWKGTTYAEAMEFCQVVDDATQTLCPYEVYCPTGPHDIPFGGTKEEGSSRAPIANHEDGWVQVGVKNTCIQYTIFSEVIDPSEEKEIESEVKEKDTASIVKESSEHKKQQLSEKEELNDISLNDHPDVGEETETRHVLCCSGDVTSIESNKVGVQTNLSNSKAAQEYEAAETFNPKWYDRSSGWKGTTHAEAVEFCQVVDDATQTLCPYEVYCPTGPHHIPLFGNKEEGLSRAPIANHENGWVQVGVKNTCIQYTIFSEVIDPSEEKEIESKAKEKGNGRSEVYDMLDYDMLDNVTEKKKEFYEEAKASKEENLAEAEVEAEVEIAAPPAKDTQFVMSGSNNPDEKPSPRPSKDATSVSSGSKNASLSPDEKDVVPIIDEQSTEHKSPVTATDSDEKDSPLQAAKEEATKESSSPVDTSKFDIATVLHQKFKPLWLGASEGWNGGSHVDAVAFCKSIRGKKLCPYSAMCPHGPGGIVMGGRHAVTLNLSGEQYAPVLGGENHWVQIGLMEEKGESVCKTHRQLHGSSPEWGVNEDKKELKQHIMCCTI